MKFIVRLLAGLASVLITTAVMIWVLNNSWFSAKFMIAKTEEAKVYTELSDTLPLVLWPGDSADAPRLRAESARETTPATIRTELEDFFVSTEAYMRTGEVLPHLPFASIQQQIYAENPDGPKPSTTVDGPLYRNLHQWYGWANSGFWICLLGGVLGSIFVLLIQQKRALRVLFGMIMSSVLTMGTWYLCFMTLPGLVMSRLQKGSDIELLYPLIKRTLVAISSGTNQLVIRGAIILGIFYLVLGILVVILRIRLVGGHGNKAGSNDNNFRDEF